MKYDNRTKYLAIGTFAMLFIGVIYAWSILKIPLAEEFGWTQAELSINFTITMCFFCLGGILGGWIKRYVGEVFTLMLGAVLGEAGLYLTGNLNGNLSSLYLSYGIMAGFGIGISYNSIISTVNSWYPDKRGLSSGCLMMGFGVSTLIMGKLAESMINSPVMGWRQAYHVLGLSMGVVLLPIALFLKVAPDNQELSSAANNSDTDRTSLQMLRSLQFWMGFGAIVFQAAVGNTVISIAKDLALYARFNSEGATLLVGILSICNGVGRVLTGLVFDRIGRGKTMLEGSVITVVATLVMLVAVLTASPLACCIGLCLTGLSYGSCPTISAAYIAEQYGGKHFAANFSIMNCNLIIASFIAALASLVNTATGTYWVAFLMLLCLSCVAMVLNRLIMPKDKKAK